ncbi:GNAT family N-acetyltransferase [Colwellia sp. D2M02]|uniref:GNAT family N-acetyltransferase n=1 Tax=Colwellia sp. D2M02 TaxID=2841562 RepID=UPI001C093E28|nr:GNAT family N-acetyltransferase [Colwellia sp. D2M02]
MTVIIATKQPSIKEFIELRESIGWGETSPQIAKTAIKNSLFHVTARRNNLLVGMARIVGDGAMFFYIQDLIVSPAFQGKGIGQLLMSNIEEYLADAAPSGATVGLLSAKSKEDFYTHYGYTKRTGSSLGLGMCKFI